MKWLWLIGNLILLGAAFSHTSDAGAVLGRYSVSYTAGLAVSAGLVGCATFLGFTRPGQNIVGAAAGRMDALVQRHGLKFVAALALLLLAGFTLLFLLPADIQYVELLLLFNTTMLLVTLGARAAPNAPQPAIPINRLLWLLLAAVLAVSFFSAHAVPHEQGHGDEAAWTNMAETLRTSGQAYIRISGHSPVTIPPGAGWWVAPYAAWLNVFGVSLASGRMFIWLIYLVVVACIGWAGARLYDRTTGLIAAILTAASPFVLTFRIIRPEIGLAAIGALLLVLYVASRKRPLWAFAAGLLATLSLEIHAAGLAYIVALILMFATDGLIALIQRRNPFERRQFAAIAGLAAGTAFYWVAHILIQADPASYFTFLRSSRDFLSGLPSGEVLARTVVSYWERSPLELLLTVLAVVALLLRRTPSDRVILRFFTFTLAAYLLLVPEPFTYLIILMPFMALGIAGLLTYGTAALPAQPRDRYAFIAAAALCAPFFALSLPGMSLNPMPATEITPVMRRARELSTPDEVVAGDGFAWWGFTDYPEFYSFWAEWEATRGLSDVASNNMWETLQPALIFMVYYPGFPDMPPALRTYLSDHGFALVDAFEWEGHRAEFYRQPAEAN